MATGTGDVKLFEHGFVFGKYYPLHNGHLELIRYAKSLCNRLTIFVCASNKETLSGEIRTSWLCEELSGYSNLHIVLLNYDEADLPNTSESDRGVSELWAKKFRQLCPTADLVVTSERYGDYVAEYMGIVHKEFDRVRTRVPVSSSMIRENLPGQWSFLPATVKRYLQRIIVITGAESTGKTVLAAELANSLNAVLVDEVGRRVIKNSNTFSKEELYKTATEHAQAIRAAKTDLLPLVIVDTDVYVTQSYAHLAFGEYLKLPESIYLESAANLRLFLSIDVPFLQDGTRLSEEKRAILDSSHRKCLQHFRQTFESISSCDWNSRRSDAQAFINKILAWQSV